MSKFALCVHAHFYQPLRGNPLTNRIGIERSAAPFRNWNERMTEEVYRPNAALGNFDTLSFDINEALMQWLSIRGQETYQRIVQAVRTYRQTNKTPNILGVPLHQCPLPLFSRRDRLTQLRWGRSVAKTRFGVEPRGVYLPEFAADLATLQSVVDAGYSFTMLRSSQVSDLPRRGGAGPYSIKLSSGDSIAVFVINDEISDSMIVDIQERCGAGYWTRQTLGSHYRHAGALTLLHIEGEMLNRHKTGAAHFIQYLLTSEARAVSYDPVTLETYFNNASKPIAEIELKPYQHRESETQRQLRDALHDLMSEANLIFVDVVGDQAWQLRDQAMSAPTEHPEMIKTQVLLQQAWAGSAALDFAGSSVDFIIDNAALAIVLLRQATGTNLAATFMDRLPEEYAEHFRAAVDAMQRDLLARVV